MSAEIVKRAEGLWTIDHPLRVGPMPVGTRTTLVGLASGEIIVHSPGPLEQGLAERMASCGTVSALVAPNCFHHLFLAENAKAFPSAAVLFPPGLAERGLDLPQGETLLETAPATWSGVLEIVAIGGAPRVGELAFFHPASRTLILSDLVFNVRSVDGAFARLAMRVNGMLGHFGPSRLARRLFFRDQGSLRSSVDRILEWDFDRVIMAHGEVVESGGHSLLEEAFAFLRD